MLLSGLLAAFVLGGLWAWYESQKACCAFPDEPPPVPAIQMDAGEKEALGLMTSLPIYWSAGAEISELAAGDTRAPWQRLALEAHAALVPLDTLSRIPGLSPDDPETDPLAELERLAVIQPRGLSPADNVALDEWVRAGGSLLLVLDPLLTGEYPFALGDPRRPADVALIPPVVERWGLEIVFDDEQPESRSVLVGGIPLTVELTGEIRLAGKSGNCSILAEGVVATCAIGEGKVTLLADAALFEGPMSLQKSAAIQAIMELSFLRS